MEKIDNNSYTSSRNDIAKIIPSNVKKVLDVGCSSGKLGKSIKEKTNARVYGIEIDKQLCSIAKKNIDQVMCTNVESIVFSKKYKVKFDCIIFADVLEHLKNPTEVLSRSIDVLSDNGVVVISIPNIRFYWTFVELFIKGEWPRNERGIFDKTHLRFFTLKNIFELLEKSNMKATVIKRKYRIVETPNKINFFARLLGIPIIREFFTHQYLIIARRNL